MARGWRGAGEVGKKYSLILKLIASPKKLSLRRPCRHTPARLEAGNILMINKSLWARI